jgi:hypothetical protein
LASELITILSAALVLTLLYGLLKPVGPQLARLALIANTVAIAGELASMLYHYAPLVYLKSNHADANEMEALSYAALRMQSAGYDLSLTFFAVFCVAVGCLIFSSGFLPRLIGAPMVIAGLCYAANSFTGFLAPTIRAGMLPWILLPCLIAESSLALWLLIVGVNAEKWRRVNGSSAPAPGVA